MLACSLVVFGAQTARCAVDLSGVWAELKILSDSVTFPLVGQLSRTTTLVQRVAIEETGASLTLRETYCAADFSNGPALTTTVDQAFIRLLDDVVVQASTDTSGVPTRFAQAWSIELHGVRLDHPETDALPTDPRDPRIFDQDGDGKPGITVHACALGAIIGDVYVIERLRTRLEGQVISTNRIEGQVEGAVEQVILGASNALFLGTIVSRPDPEPAHSYFVLQRVDPTSTCAEILFERAALFDE